MGEYIQSIQQDVEAELGVELEPSIQGGQGGMYAYTEDYGNEYIGSYTDFCNQSLDLVLKSKSEKAFKSAYKDMLNELIPEAPEDYFEAE